MEEMLKTWKEPVPGSIDTRPVFPIEVTRPIESALIKARTSALQAQQEYARSQPQIMRQRPGLAQQQYRQTPTPPNVTRPSQYALPGYAAPQDRGTPQPQEQLYGTPPYVQPQQQYGSQLVRPGSNLDPRQIEQVNGQTYIEQQYTRPTSATPSWQQQQQQQPPVQAYGAPDASLETLKSDIARLISVSKNDFGQNMLDKSLQTRLKALLDLQTILQTQRLPPDQLAAVRAQVDQLSITSTPQPQPAPTPVQQPTQGPTLSSLFGQNGLAALLARSSATPQIQTPPSRYNPPAAIRSPQPAYTQPYVPPAAAAAPAAPPAASNLLEQLRAAGLLPATPTPSAATPLPLPNALAGSIPPGFPPNFSSIGVGPPKLPFDLPNDIDLKRPQSVKM